MSSLKQHLLSTRPWSFSMSAISVTLGTLIAAGTANASGYGTSIHWPSYIAVIIGTVLVHCAGNVLNDYFDTKSRVDQPDTGTVNYRPHPIYSGLLSPRGVLIEAAILLAIAAGIGVWLAVARSMLVFWIALTGVVLTVSYTAKPLALKYRALGEVVVFLIWGPLQFEGAYAVQTGHLSLEALIASIPFGILVALVLFANNARDIEHDDRMRITTLPIVLGRHGSYVAFAAIIVSAYLYVVGAVALRALTPWALLVFLSLPTALQLLRAFRVSFPEMADALTAKLDTVFGLLFVAALVISGLR